MVWSGVALALSAALFAHVPATTGAPGGTPRAEVRIGQDVKYVPWTRYYSWTRVIREDESSYHCRSTAARAIPPNPAGQLDIARSEAVRVLFKHRREPADLKLSVKHRNGGKPEPVPFTLSPRKSSAWRAALDLSSISPGMQNLRITGAWRNERCRITNHVLWVARLWVAS